MTGVVPATAPDTTGAVPDGPPGSAVLAVDIGGTKLAAALVEPDGRLRGHAVRPTPRGDTETVWAALAAVVGEALGEETVTAAGIGSAGPLDAVAGTVSPVNIRSWREFPVRDRLAALLGGPPVTLANDAVAGAVAEYRHGAGRGSRAMLGMVVSTGVGGGLILDGRVYAGPTGNAGHVGHTVVDLNGEPCPCGSRGCVETLTSGPAMVRWALGNGWTHPAPDGAALAADARTGHPVAVAAFERACRGLAAGIASAAALCDLDRVVIGGGVSRSWDVLEPPLVRAMGDYAGLAFVRRVAVVPSELGAEAGLLGAAALAHDPELV
ncbi:ROK family protein [Actinoallomurus soli]|uniref:ROK family protein n=1 Tax=Actinoallomurus soli TaxID=2952535 RepID=UPI002092342F|nr:ROK family protein [Actinoallomurus soli]MCO5971761.1 ROK family protein [Actinoallomurus soli]